MCSQIYRCDTHTSTYITIPTHTHPPHSPPTPPCIPSNTHTHTHSNTQLPYITCITCIPHIPCLSPIYTRWTHWQSLAAWRLTGTSPLCKCPIYKPSQVLWGSWINRPRHLGMLRLLLHHDTCCLIFGMMCVGCGVGWGGGGGYVLLDFWHDVCGVWGGVWAFMCCLIFGMMWLVCAVLLVCAVATHHVTMHHIQTSEKHMFHSLSLSHSHTHTNTGVSMVWTPLLLKHFPHLHALLPLCLFN